MNEAARTRDDKKLLAAIGSIDKMGVSFQTGIKERRGDVRSRAYFHRRSFVRLRTNKFE